MMGTPGKGLALESRPWWASRVFWGNDRREREYNGLEERANGRYWHKERLIQHQWWELRYVHKGGIIGIQHVMEFEMANRKTLGVGFGGKHVIA